MFGRTRILEGKQAAFTIGILNAPSVSCTGLHAQSRCALSPFANYLQYFDIFFCVSNFFVNKNRRILRYTKARLQGTPPLVITSVETQFICLGLIWFMNPPGLNEA